MKPLAFYRRRPSSGERFPASSGRGARGRADRAAVPLLSTSMAAYGAHLAHETQGNERSTYAVSKDANNRNSTKGSTASTLRSWYGLRMRRLQGEAPMISPTDRNSVEFSSDESAPLGLKTKRYRTGPSRAEPLTGMTLVSSFQKELLLSLQRRAGSPVSVAPLIARDLTLRNTSAVAQQTGWSGWYSRWGKEGLPVAEHTSTRPSFWVDVRVHKLAHLCSAQTARSTPRSARKTTCP